MALYCHRHVCVMALKIHRYDIAQHEDSRGFKQIFHTKQEKQIGNPMAGKVGLVE